MRSARFTTAFLLIALAAACSKAEDNATPSIRTFLISKETVSAGDRVILIWNTDADAVTVQAEPGGTLLDMARTSTGSLETPPLTLGTRFTLIARNDNAKTSSASVQVTIDARPRIASFAATPNPAILGSSVVLSYEVYGATEVRVLNAGTVVYTAPGNALSRGSFSTSPLVDPLTAFELVISNGRDRATQQMSVAAGPPPSITTFTAEPRYFAAPNTPIAVSYRAMNAERTVLTANGVPVPGFLGNVEGSFVVNLSDTTNLELNAEGGGARTKTSLFVTKATIESEPNNELGQATVLSELAARGEITAGDQDLYRIEVLAGGHVIAETVGPEGAGTCAFDTTLTLLSATGAVLGTSTDADIGNLCSRIDPRSDNFAGDLDAGTYYLRVGGQGSAIGAYLLNVQIGSPQCGNAILERGETCDAGPPTGLPSRCPATCQVSIGGRIDGEAGAVTVELAAGSFTQVAVIVPNGERRSISAQLASVANGCDNLSSIALLDQRFRVLQASRAETPPNGTQIQCANLPFPGRGGHIDLVAGRYYLEVRNESASPTSLTLTVRLERAACPNRTIESGEACDDGNSVAGDGCSATCAVEATTVLTGPVAEEVFTGALVPGETDRFAVTLTRPGYIDAQSFIPALESCTGDTVLDVFSGTLGERVGGNDDISGTNACSRVEPVSGGDLLMAGTYVLALRPFATAPIPAYAFRISLRGTGCGNGFIEPGETCDDANTVAGDGCSTKCAFEGSLFNEREPNNLLDIDANITGLQPGRSLIAAGALAQPGDVDTYVFDIVGSPASLVARTHTDPTNQATCVLTDTALELVDTHGRTVARNDDSATDTCSRIAPADYPEVRTLTPGRYFVRVRSYNPTRIVPIYYLSLTLQ